MLVFLCVARVCVSCVVSVVRIACLRRSCGLRGLCLRCELCVVVLVACCAISVCYVYDTGYGFVRVLWVAYAVSDACCVFLCVVFVCCALCVLCLLYPLFVLVV